MKKVGIAADNYKLERFKKELEEAGFKEYTIKPFTKGVSIINIMVELDKIDEVKKICQKVELFFKRGN